MPTTVYGIPVPTQAEAEILVAKAEMERAQEAAREAMWKSVKDFLFSGPPPKPVPRVGDNAYMKYQRTKLTRDLDLAGQDEMFPLDKKIETMIREIIEDRVQEINRNSYAGMTYGVPFWYGGLKCPAREHNVITPLIGGDAAFAKVAEIMRKATKTIDIAFWGIDMDMLLNRASLLKRSNTHYEYDPEYLLSSIILKKAKEGVKINILKWTHVALKEPGAMTFGNPKENHDASSAWFFHLVNTNGTRSIPQLSGKEQYSYLKNIKFLDIPSTSRWSMFPSFHQKIVLTDIADPENHNCMVMGHNMQWIYWDDSNMDNDNPKRDLHIQRQKSVWTTELREAANARPTDTTEHVFSPPVAEYERHQPWLDVSTHVRGPCAVDVYENFRHLIGLHGHPLPDPGLDPTRYVMKPDESKTQTAQVSATFDERYVYDAFLNYISSVFLGRKYVLVLSQYFRFYNLLPTIIKMMREKRQVLDEDMPIFFVVTNEFGKAPDKPSPNQEDDSVYKAGTIGEGANTESDGGWTYKSVEALKDTGVKCVFCQMVTPGIVAENWRDIYIHAKVLIVDDVFYGVGSSNFNLRSLLKDEEMNIFSHNPVRAAELRSELWARFFNGEEYADVMGNQVKFLKSVTDAQRNTKTRLRRLKTTETIRHLGQDVY